MAHLLIVDDNKELADLLSQIFREAGYQTKVLHRGKQAIESVIVDPPVAAIVDLLLPDVIGHDVAKVLHARGIPFVYTTGVFKGSAHAQEAIVRHGARAFFEKPFNSADLVASIRALVPPPPASTPAPPEEMEVELDIDVEDGEAPPLELTGQIAIAGRGVSAVLTGQDFKLDPPTPSQLVVRKPDITGGPPLGRTERGHLRDNLPELINAFWLLQETGELWLRRGAVKKAIFFERGQPVFALSNLAVDRFGTFLVRLGRIGPEQLREATARAGAEKRRTGDVLVEMDALQDSERMYFVAQQVKAIIYSLFAWPEGEYVMSFQHRATHEPIRLGIHPAQLVARGIKKLYKPERLARLLAPEERLQLSLEPAYRVQDACLEPWEMQLLEHVDGQRTAAELLAGAGRPAEQARASLVAMLALKIVEKRG